MLTEIETQIVDLLKTGKSNDEIAAAMGVRVKTVKWHLTRIYKKTGSSGDRQLLAKFISNLTPNGPLPENIVNV